jgi:hypothetical protein
VLFASHTVGNDPQIYFLSHSECVFIVLSYAAYVGLGSDVNAELAAVVHANSLSCTQFSVPVVSRTSATVDARLVINGPGPSLLFLQSAVPRPFFLVESV